MKNFLRLGCLVLLLGTLALPAIAATAAAHTENKATPLSIIVDHGIPLSLSGPATSVFIANPEIADVQVMSPTSIMIFGKRTGATTFMATDSSGHTLAHRTITVTQDLTDLRRELDAAIPGNNIKVQSIPNGIVLMGDTRDPAAVADAYKLAQRYIPASGGDIINRIHVAGSNQIQIRVRFAEVSRSVNNTLGIDWDTLGSYGGFVFGLASGAPFMNAAMGTVGAITRPNNPSLTTSNNVMSFQHSGGRSNINAIIDALAQEGLVTILAEPNLTAMSGETASFLAGGEFPIPIPQSSGSTGGTIITVSFKDYGISLAFTPTLVGEDRINLHVKPEVSELTTTGAIQLDNITVPALTTRKAETTVEVASGESFAIAGLVNNSQSQTVDKYPLIGDMPVLGALFRSNQFQNNQSELVIIITPYIVRPTGNRQLALPTDGFSPPSESDRLLKLRYNSSDSTTRTMSGAPLAAPIDPVSVEEKSSDVAPTEPVNLNPTPVPAARHNPSGPSPTGPGGFVVE